MKAKISELLDGELEPHEAAGPLDALRSEGASLAAVALVGWVAFGLQENPAQMAKNEPAVPVQAVAAQVAPPAAANDYLYAHQGLSPRNSLQGVAPYVRMVSGETSVQKR